MADQNETLHYMAASSEGARHLELFQLQHSEVPAQREHYQAMADQILAR